MYLSKLTVLNTFVNNFITSLFTGTFAIDSKSKFQNQIPRRNKKEFF